jgi:hypothetical protein
MHTRTVYRTALSVAVLLTALVVAWPAGADPNLGTTTITDIWVGSGAKPAANPTSGNISSAAGGTIISITGNGFVGTSNIYFNATYPPNASPGNGDVTGTNVAGWQGNGIIGPFSPATPATSFQWNSDSLIFARVPIGAHAGPVVVCSPTGCAESLGCQPTGCTATNGVLFGLNVNTNDFLPDFGGEMNPPTPTSTLPVVTYFTPGYVKAGQTVIMNGSLFTGATAVKVAGKAAKFRVKSDTQIVFTIPAGTTAGLRHVSVTTPAGLSSAKGPGITVTG